MSRLVLPFLSLLLVPWPAAAQLPTSLNLDAIRALPVQHDGRWPPLDTVARDIVESVTGNAFHEGHDAVLLLLAWTFEPEVWQGQPLIKIDSAELRAELELPSGQTAFSYTELSTHQPFLALVDALRRAGSGRKLNPLEAKVGEIHQKLFTLRQLFGGRAIRVIPDSENLAEAWRPIPRHAPEDGRDDAVGLAWTSLGDAFRADDAPAFAAGSEQLISALAALPAAYRPDPALIATELRYNRLQPFRTAWMMMVIGTALAAAALLTRRERAGALTAAGGFRRGVDVLTGVVLLAGFGLLTYGLLLRWEIAGRIPAANMFESLLFLSWGASGFAVLSLAVLRDRLVPLTASAIGALSLILADCLPLDHYIRPIVPVLLDTIWMSIHVPVIMISYAVLAAAVVIAHVQLVTMAVVPGRGGLAEKIDRVHYWYVHIGALLLLGGIITGSMWAAASWGRYWGWDPKEVWSLVAFLGYLAILHVRIDRAKIPPWAYVVAALLAAGVFVLVVPQLAPLTPLKLVAFAGTGVAMLVFLLARGRFATALKSILAFWLIIMTYVGVNYVLGIGLHSYGFGTGAVVRYFYLIAGIDLALIAVCCAVYLARGVWGGGSQPRPWGTGINRELAP